jgi:hypothetical protein
VPRDAMVGLADLIDGQHAGPARPRVAPAGPRVVRPAIRLDDSVVRSTIPPRLRTGPIPVIAEGTRGYTDGTDDARTVNETLPREGRR